MNKLISQILCVSVFCLMLTCQLQARPCTPYEMQFHNAISKQLGSGECFKPDPHPLPYGIYYTKGKDVHDHYIYYINQGKQPVVISVEEMPPEGDIDSPRDTSVDADSEWSVVMTIPPNSYYVDSALNTEEYEFKMGKSTVMKKIPRLYLRKSGPAICTFYKIWQKNGNVAVEEIGEKTAINIMKTMKRAKR